MLEKLNLLEQAYSTHIILTKPVLNLKEASQYMGISTSMLYKLTSARGIPHSRPNGKLLFFSKEDLDAWMMRNPQRVKASIR
ncbi:helix-turn-helix domain-containing protein [Pontibacter sp. BT310]|uniref:Helix-turn-helix domain-containing protein n=2 Tax=Hymenobacteraceae TaxID=1853232 RepID=A0ABS6XCZ6_9BACT|nr:helix-turn-helix domain-containing protein [Pontibacter sp. BT310]MBR0571449.1 helix-turn-helix domain-containing protein [Microvirga sp. STS03]MBW3365875.1 helix-turn-helix domain-containing protein [Pontibacter populi]